MGDSTPFIIENFKLPFKTFNEWWFLCFWLDLTAILVVKPSKRLLLLLHKGRVFKYVILASCLSYHAFWCELLSRNLVKEIRLLHWQITYVILTNLLGNPVREIPHITCWLCRWLVQVLNELNFFSLFILKFTFMH